MLGKMEGLKKIITKDSSITYYNEEGGDYYHSVSGARQEAFEKHAKALRITEKNSPVIFDICFGLGYNTAAALDMIEGPCTVFCFENDREILGRIAEIHADFKSYGKIREFASSFLEKGKTDYSSGRAMLRMFLGDARKNVPRAGRKADFVFFDPFSPSKEPWMWSSEFLSAIRLMMNHGAKLSTYSCAGLVRKNMAMAGFSVRDGPSVGRRSPGTIGTA